MPFISLGVYPHQVRIPLEVGVGFKQAAVQKRVIGVVAQPACACINNGLRPVEVVKLYIVVGVRVGPIIRFVVSNTAYTLGTPTVRVGYASLM